MIGPFRSYIIRFALNEVPHSLLVSLKMTIFTKLHLVVDFCVFTSQVTYYIRQQIKWILFYQGS